MVYEPVETVGHGRFQHGGIIPGGLCQIVRQGTAGLQHAAPQGPGGEPGDFLAQVEAGDFTAHEGGWDAGIEQGLPDMDVEQRDMPAHPLRITRPMAVFKGPMQRLGGVTRPAGWIAPAQGTEEMVDQAVFLTGAPVSKAIQALGRFQGQCEVFSQIGEPAQIAGAEAGGPSFDQPTT